MSSPTLAATRPDASYTRRIADFLTGQGHESHAARSLAENAVKRWATGTTYDGAAVPEGTRAQARVEAKGKRGSGIRMTPDELTGLAEAVKQRLDLCEGMALTLAWGTDAAVKNVRALVEARGKPATLTLGREPADPDDLAEARRLLDGEVAVLRGLLGGVGVKLEEAQRGTKAKAMPAEPKAKPPKPGKVKEDETPERTAALQRRLTSLGHELKDDGKFGPKTDAAVREFQRHAGIKDDGVVGPTTTDLLKMAPPPEVMAAAEEEDRNPTPTPTPGAAASAPPVPPPVTGAAAGAAAPGAGAAQVTMPPMLYKGIGVGEGPHGAVEQVQTQLAATGQNVAVDGVFGPATEKATKRFQRRWGMKADGLVGPKTQVALAGASKAVGDLAEAVAVREAAQRSGDSASFTRARARERVLRRRLEEAEAVHNYQLVGPHAKKKLSGLIKHYMSKPHPFTSCVRDNRKRFGSRAEKVCAVLKDIGMGTTKWRKGGKKKLSEAEVVDEAIWRLVEAGVRDAEGVDLIEGYLMDQLDPEDRRALEEGQIPILLEADNPREKHHRLKCPKCGTVQSAKGDCEKCGHDLTKARKAKFAKLDEGWMSPEELAEVSLRGAGRVPELKRLPDGTFAPKGRGQVLRPGMRVRVPHKSGKGTVTGVVIGPKSVDGFVEEDYMAMRSAGPDSEWLVDLRDGPDKGTAVVSKRGGREARPTVRQRAEAVLDRRQAEKVKRAMADADRRSMERDERVVDSEIEQAEQAVAYFEAVRGSMSGAEALQSQAQAVLDDLRANRRGGAMRRALEQPGGTKGFAVRDPSKMTAEVLGREIEQAEQAVAYFEAAARGSMSGAQGLRDQAQTLLDDLRAERAKRGGGWRPEDQLARARYRAGYPMGADELARATTPLSPEERRRRRLREGWLSPEELAEASLRGAARKIELKRLPDGTFAPKGRGQVLRPGMKVSVPHKSGKGTVTGEVKDAQSEMVRVDLLDGPDKGAMLPVKQSPEKATAGQRATSRGAVNVSDDPQTQRATETLSRRRAELARTGHSKAAQDQDRIVKRAQAMVDQKSAGAPPEPKPGTPEFKAAQDRNAAARAERYGTPAPPASPGTGGQPLQTNTGGLSLKDLPLGTHIALADGQRYVLHKHVNDPWMIMKPIDEQGNVIGKAKPIHNMLAPPQHGPIEEPGSPEGVDAFGQAGVKSQWNPGSMSYDTVPKGGDGGDLFNQLSKSVDAAKEGKLPQQKKPGPKSDLEQYAPKAAEKQKAAKAASAAGTEALANSPGRGPKGKIRSFKKMLKPKLAQVIKELEDYGKDPEALAAAKAAAAAKGFAVSGSEPDKPKAGAPKSKVTAGPEKGEKAAPGPKGTIDKIINGDLSVADVQDQLPKDELPGIAADLKDRGKPELAKQLLGKKADTDALLKEKFGDEAESIGKPKPGSGTAFPVADDDEGVLKGPHASVPIKALSDEEISVELEAVEKGAAAMEALEDSMVYSSALHEQMKEAAKLLKAAKAKREKAAAASAEASNAALQAYKAAGGNDPEIIAILKKQK